MENSWHIPRATLGSGSGSGTSSQKSSTSIKSSDINLPDTHRGRNNLAFQNDGKSKNAGKRPSDNGRRLRDIDKSNGSHINSNGKSSSTENNEAVKRGSQSSQGSASSNHSSHSASSGSMLLTAANLEHFAKIHKKLHSDDISSRIQHQLYNTNITLPPAGVSDSARQDTAKPHPGDTILPIDLMRAMTAKAHTKDLDTLSVASSTHFTVVNGVGGPQRPTKEGICSRGHQITVLILTMSIIFLIGIVAAVFMLEMRAQRMPHM